MNINGIIVDNDGKPLKAVHCVLCGGPVVTHANTDGGQVCTGVGLVKARMEIGLMVVMIAVATIIHVLAAHVINKNCWKLAVKAMEVSLEGYLEDAAESNLDETSFQELDCHLDGFVKKVVFASFFGNGYSLKDKNKAKTDKTEHGIGKSMKSRS
ncbi:hypothetical protein Tco_0650887 [Tanacetum coccineum]